MSTDEQIRRQEDRLIAQRKRIWLSYVVGLVLLAVTIVGMMYRGELFSQPRGWASFFSPQTAVMWLLCAGVMDQYLARIRTIRRYRELLDRSGDGGR